MSDLYWIEETNGEDYEDEFSFIHVIISQNIQKVKETFCNYIKKSYRTHRKKIRDSDYVPCKSPNFKEFVVDYFSWYEFPDWNDILNHIPIKEDDLIHLYEPDGEEI